MALTKALDLEASSSQSAFINKADQTGLDFSGDMTIEAWIKPESFDAARNIIVSDFRTAGGGTIQEKKFFFSVANSGTELELRVSDDGATNYDAIASYSFSTGVWYWVCVRYDASAGTAEFFVNGSSIGSGGSLCTSLYVTSYNWPLKVGQFQASSNEFDGLIQSLRIFDDMRTNPELAADMCADSVTDANLQAEWSFDDTYADSSGNGNTLTPGGGPVFVTDYPAVCNVTNNQDFLNFF